MINIYCYQGSGNPNVIILSDPTKQRSIGSLISAAIIGTVIVLATASSTVASIIEPWMMRIPMTQTVDIANNSNYPMAYRVGAASVMKYQIQKTIDRYCGTLQGVESTLAMVARMKAESSEFAQIYDSAPIISGL